MLPLLLATRLRYYRNFIRAHFDRVTILEFGAIFLIFFFLTLRSPADIGYRLEFLSASDFPQKWASLWAALLPLFYLTAEAFALITLRPTGEAQILGTLPIAHQAILPYHLVRHFLKTFGLIFFGAAFFLIGKYSLGERAVAALTALTFMLALQLLAFVQAYGLCRRLLPTRRSSAQGKRVAGGFSKVLRWFVIESVILITLLFTHEHFNLIPHDFSWALRRFLLALAMLTGAWVLARRRYDPALLLEAQPLFKSNFRRKETESQKAAAQTEESHEPLQASSSSLGRVYLLQKFPPKSFGAAQIKRDLLFLKRQKPSLLFLCGGATVLLILASWMQTQAVQAYSSSLFIHLVYCALMINAQMVLFEHDGPAFGLLRALPISAAQFWCARWLLVSALLALPMLPSTLIVAAKFGLSAQLGLFMLATWLILPMIFALLLCNAAFSMFPHAKYAAILMNVFALLMILFWFYMPFGTLILLGFTLTRVRKSQRHFQHLQLE